MKRCNKCGETKPLTEFHKDRSTKSGLNAYCKPCQIARQAAYDALPPRFQAPPGMKRCAACKEIKPLDQFAKQKRQYDGHQPACKKCLYARHKAWASKPEVKARLAKEKRERYAADPERFKDYMAKRFHNVPKGWYAATLAAQNGRCAICGTDTPGGQGRFHIDHDHNTGHKRGLLCSKCNLGIGHLSTLSILNAAIAYLERPPLQPKAPVPVAELSIAAPKS